VVVARTGEYYARPVLRGMAHVLTGAGARVIALSGDEYSSIRRERNAIYDLLDRRTVDGAIILGGTLFHQEGAAGLFRSRHADVKLVSVGAEMPDTPSVLADNCAGMRSAVLHLAALGRRRIAFIRGPTSNTEAAERYRGYREGLEQAGLRLDPELIAPGAFVVLSGEKAVDLLLDERGLSPDAIVAANDPSARGALNALQRRGISVPDDIALIGFDDVIDAELCRPKLTTVAPPLVEQGVQAALQLERLLAGESVPPRLTLDVHLVYRESCGGQKRALGAPPLAAFGRTESARSWIDKHFAQLWPWVQQRAGWSRLDELNVREALTALLDVRSSARRVDASVDAAIQRAPMGESWRWFRALSDLRAAILPLVDAGLRGAITGSFERATQLVQENIVGDRARESDRAQLEREFTRLFAHDLLGARNSARLLETLRLNLETHPAIAGYHLSLYDDGDASWSRLVMSSSLRDASAECGVRFLTRTVLPQAAFPPQRAAALCATALCYDHPAHGTLVLEASLEEAVRVCFIAELLGIWLHVHAKEEAAPEPHLEHTDGVPKRIGSYPILGCIGRGGMATVYRGEMRVAGVPRPVALKLMHPHLQDRMGSEQFVEEARITASILHPNVVQVLELGEHAGGMFLVMDYVDGANLANLLVAAKQCGTHIPLRVSARVLADALAGLHAAHDLKDGDGLPVSLVHRDVSLQNILVGRDGVTRITDFGIARHKSTDTTRTGVLKGKLRYMSPEQVTGAPLDRRADVWSMGVVSWELFAVRRMYAGESDISVIRSLSSAAPPRVSSVVDIPPEIDAVVARALTVNPADRFATALEFRTALLEAFRAGGGVADAEEVAEVVRDVLSLQTKLAPPRRTGCTALESLSDLAAVQAAGAQPLAPEPVPAQR